MNIAKIRSSFIRPASATQYTAGDEVSNSATAGSVVRATFNMSGFQYGRIKAAAVDITAASSNVVTTAADLEILVFRTDDVPAAVGDNTTNPLTAPVRATAIGGFRFDDTGWTGPLGTVAAGASQFQAVLPHLVQPLATPVLQSPFSDGFSFDLRSVETKELTVVVRALAAWNPGNVANTIGITLDIEAE